MNLLKKIARFAVDFAKQLLPEYVYQHLLFRFARWNIGKRELSSTNYWNSHHVSFSPTIEFVKYRRERYYNYEECMPSSGHDGKVILDYGCGPGIESAALLTDSSNVDLYYADVSQRSLKITEKFLDDLQLQARPIFLAEDGWDTKLDNESVDYIHCTGVLHHTKYPTKILNEFKRILKPDGHINLMVYHKNSVYYYLYIQYIIQKLYRLQTNMNPKDVFREHTDGPNCPISHAWTFDEVRALCEECKLKPELIGTSYEPQDLAYIDKIPEAIYEEGVSQNARRFLKKIKYDESRLPFFISNDGKKIGAGLHLCIKVTK